MLEKAEYLRFKKRGTACAQCGASLLGVERHPSTLIEPDEKEREVLDEPAADADLPAEKPANAKPAEEAEDSGFQRFDYCDKCWAQKKDKAFFCFWVGKRTTTDLPPKKLNRAERNLALLALFDSLSDKKDAETDYTPHLFFLAHLLMKFRIFKWQPSEPHPETGVKMLSFLRADTQEPVLLPDIHLEDETIVRLKEEIESYLQESTGQAIRL